MSWLYCGKIIEKLPEDCIGFVYLITNLATGKKYIGKKQAHFTKTKPPLKGKKNRRRVTTTSDWQTYWGSSEELKRDLEKLGEQNFKREILYFCTTKAEMSYIEARTQFDMRVLESDEYYNGIIKIKVGKSKALSESLKKYDKD